MRNRFKYLVALLMGFHFAGAQMIEASSRPYRFEIDKILEINNISVSYKFDLRPNRIKIRELIEVEVSKWYREIGYQHFQELTFQERVVQKIEEFQPKAINDIGEQTFRSCIPEFYFIQKSLKFEIRLNGFKPFYISIPLADVESFANYFEKLQFSSLDIAFNLDDLFVLQYVEIFNPGNGKRYVFSNSDEGIVTPPPFSISVPEFDL